jgi:hypothetical protein
VAPNVGRDVRVPRSCRPISPSTPSPSNANAIAPARVKSSWRAKRSAQVAISFRILRPRRLVPVARGARPPSRLEDGECLPGERPGGRIGYGLTRIRAARYPQTSIPATDAPPAVRA